MNQFTTLGVGDSITAGSGASKQFVTAWFPLVCASMKGAAQYAATYTTGPSSGNRNIGVSGRTLQTMASLAPANEWAFAGIAGPPKHLLTLMGGANDLVGGRTLAQMEADMTTYLTRAAAAGYLVCVLTVLPTTTITGAAETQRTDFNTWLIANAVTLGASVLSDVGSLASMQTPSGGNYADGIHPSDAGHLIVATQVLADLAAIL